ncbi:MAG: TetR/AcrR family transcriptional regulator [Pseudomonadota bacterium]
MPKLKPETARARRAHILDAAERCFVRRGFHGTSMQDILQEAGVSTGALYGYFDSKEALIAGLCERDRQDFTRSLEAMAAAPDFIAAMHQMLRHYTVDYPHRKLVMHLEIGAEATRNHAIQALYREVDAAVRAQFTAEIARAHSAGRLHLKGALTGIADALCALGDGLIWRRATDPTFDAQAVLPVVMAMVAALVEPATDAASQAPSSRAAEAGSAAAGAATSEAETDAEAAS